LDGRTRVEECVAGTRTAAPSVLCIAIKIEL
jgi:hypothetical protein